MPDYPRIKHALHTFFNAEDGLSEEVSRRLLARSMRTPEAMASFMRELQAALADPELSWRSMLFNDEYEVVDALSEAEAREFVQRNLVEPLAAPPTGPL